MRPSPRVLDLTDRIFDVIAADDVGAGDALEALLLSAAVYGRQCRASEDGMRRLLAEAMEAARAGLPDLVIEVVDHRDMAAAIRETAAKHGTPLGWAGRPELIK